MKFRSIIDATFVIQKTNKQVILGTDCERTALRAFYLHSPKCTLLMFVDGVLVDYSQTIKSLEGPERETR